MRKFVSFVIQTALLTLLGFALVNGVAYGVLRLRSTTEPIPSLLSMENREAFRHYPEREAFFSELNSLYDRQYRGKVYEPFALWKEVPHKGRFITINDDGYRSSTIAENANLSSALSVAFFGGSSMFSAATPDSETIPSRVAAELRTHSPPETIRPLNFGVDGHLSTQELMRFLTLTIDGEIPSKAVFYHGVNDIYLGVILNQPHTFYERFTSVLNRKAAVIEFGSSLTMKLPIIKLLRGTVPEWPTLDEATLQSRITKTTQHWLNTVKTIQSVARSRGVAPYFVLQPDLFSTGKPLSDEEVSIKNSYPPVLSKALIQGRASMVQAAHGSVQVLDCAHCLDSITETTFIDFCHITTPGNRAIGQKIAELLSPK